MVTDYRVGLPYSCRLIHEVKNHRSLISESLCVCVTCSRKQGGDLTWGEWREKEKERKS